MDPFFTKILRGSWNKNDYCICNESCSSIFNFRLVIEQVLKNARWRLPVDEFSSLICLAQALTKKSSRSMLASALSSYLLKYHKYTVMWHQKLIQNYNVRKLAIFSGKIVRHLSSNHGICYLAYIVGFTPSFLRVFKKGQILDFTYMLEYLLELTSGLSGISTRFFSIKGP